MKRKVLFACLTEGEFQSLFTGASVKKVVESLLCPDKCPRVMAFESALFQDRPNLWV